MTRDMTLPTHAGGIVYRLKQDLEFLIVQSSTDRDHWVLPKGHIIPGETPEMAAVREIREEAGVEAEVLSTLGRSTYRHAGETVRILYFLMKYNASTKAQEDREVLWCSYERAATTLSFDDARRLLQKALSAISERGDAS